MAAIGIGDVNRATWPPATQLTIIEHRRKPERKPLVLVPRCRNRGGRSERRL